MLMSDISQSQARKIVVSRLEISGVSTDYRYVDVENGGKRCLEKHSKRSNRYNEPPEGNYGVYLTANDGLVVLDVDDYEDEANSGLMALEALPETFAEESPHGGEHYYYYVRPENGQLIASILENRYGTKNPIASWGEVQVSNKYVVAAGCELTDCKKDWHDCSQPCEGHYEIANDAEIAELDADTLTSVLEADPDIEVDYDDRQDEQNNHKDIERNSIDLRERLEYAREQDEKLDRLVRGDYSDYNNDRSEAEAGLAAKLAFWLEGDLRLVEQALDHHANTQKWAERDDDSYRGSILDAARQQTTYYDPDALGDFSIDLEDEPSQMSDEERREEAKKITGRLTYYYEGGGEEEIEINKKTLIHKTAKVIDRYWSWLYPDPGVVGGWVQTLYIYDPDEGIYKSIGESILNDLVQDLLGKYADSHVKNEIQDTIEARNRADQCAIQRRTPDDNELVVGNGILNLREGELRDYTSKEYHRIRIDVDWNPDAEVAEIDSFIRGVVRGRDVDTVYRSIAHCLLRDYPSGKAHMWAGEGSNGKGTLLKLVEEFIGTENIASRGLKRLVEYPFAAQDMEGKLANLEGDLSPGQLEDTRMLKKLTGDDHITADVKSSNDPKQFKSFATQIFAVNEVPTIPEDSFGFWRRWVYIPFPNRFEGNDKIPKEILMERLTADEELEGLLVRCVKEIQRYYETGEFYPDVDLPEEVREQMKNASNPVRDFLTTAFIEVDDPNDGHGKVLKDRVVKAYYRYAEQEGLPKYTEQKLKTRIPQVEDIAVETGQSRSITDGSNIEQVYKGIEWTARGRQLAGLDEPEEGQGTLDVSREIGDATVGQIRDYVESHDNMDVYDVMRHFALTGDHFDDVMKVIDLIRSDDFEGDEEPEGKDNDGESNEMTREEIAEAAEEYPDLNAYELIQKFDIDPSRFESIYRVVNSDSGSGERENAPTSVGEELASPSDITQQGDDRRD